jgi:arylsulfatase A-like enzyme
MGPRGLGRYTGPTDRRTFLRSGVAAGGALAFGGWALDRWATAAPAPRRRSAQPNILVVIVDQMRTPKWFPAPATLAAVLPNITALRNSSVSFEQHYTASNDCTPSRGVLLTGLYSHQTGCMLTNKSKLDPGFPTWGTMLRDMGYRTSWWGKWHLSRGHTLEPYGFDGGTFPSPNGGPGQGTRMDPKIVDQFQSWFASSSADEPWCTTVSLVNPHDIAWWYRFTRRKATERSAPRVFSTLPANFETPGQLVDQAKPAVQLSLQQTADHAFGYVAYEGPKAMDQWTSFMDLYLELQRYVDFQIGRVLGTLASRPEVLANTVIVFTSDHGEYGGSHGLRGKGAGAYDEALRVPLMVADMRGRITRETGQARQQLTSSADVAGLLLTIGYGSDGWRGDPKYAHLAGRHNLAAICADPAAPGRPWIVHATDEQVSEFASAPYSRSAPLHVIAMRTPHAKYATYSNWQAHSLKPRARGTQAELYDYRTRSGRLEIENVAERSDLEESMHRTLVERVIPHELQAPLPAQLRKAQRRGMANYHQGADAISAEAALAVDARAARV